MILLHVASPSAVFLMPGPDGTGPGSRPLLMCGQWRISGVDLARFLTHATSATSNEKSEVIAGLQSDTDATLCSKKWTYCSIYAAATS